jgi:hypothetical protein
MCLQSNDDSLLSVHVPLPVVAFVFVLVPVAAYKNSAVGDGAAAADYFFEYFFSFVAMASLKSKSDNRTVSESTSI